MYGMKTAGTCVLYLHCAIVPLAMKGCTGQPRQFSRACVGPCAHAAFGAA